MNTPSDTLRDSVESTDLLADLERSLDAAVKEYEAAIMRSPADESEIRRAVDKCHSARLRFNAANTTVEARRDAVASDGCSPSPELP